MRLLKLLAVSMLVWGNLASANLPPNGGGHQSNQDLETISSWMVHLNQFYPDLELTTSRRADLNNARTRKQALQELQALDNVLRGLVAVPPGSLQTLACVRPQCGGGE
jgi:hypothetical protein